MQSLVWILFFYLLGELLSQAIGGVIPGSVLGMLLLFGALSAGWLRAARVRAAAAKLLEYMPLFFVPIGVGLITSFALIGAHWVAILVSCVVSTVLVLVLVGWMAQLLERRNKHPKTE